MPVAANAQSHGVTQAQLDSLAEIMNQAVEQEQIAGGSFLVAHKGEVVFRCRSEAAVHNGRVTSGRIDLQALPGKRDDGAGR
jgi:hypothetical protein